MRELTFTARTLLLPIVAAVGFVALVATTSMLNNRTTNQLREIDEKVYPSLVLSLELKGLLEEIYFELQNAVTFDSPEGLEDADSLHETFRVRLREAEESAEISPETREKIEGLLDQYYPFARITSERMISRDAGMLSQLDRMRELYDHLEASLLELGDANREQMQGAFKMARSRQKTAMTVMLVVALISLAVLSWVSWWVIGSVRILATEVAGGAHKMSAAATEVLAATRQQEQGANQHAGAIEETSRTIESLAESSRSIAELAEAVLENAQRTQGTNQEIAARNQHLTSRLEGITSILESVKDIANKSELLALNAALEGTKAGEAGRGFSFVAVQMQRLAENVMGNVKDIKILTREIREANHTTVLAIEEGTKLAQETTRSAGQIRLVTQQQESATQQVTENMIDAAQRVQQTVAGVRQSTAAMESLAELATQLNELLHDLRVESRR